MANLSCSIEMEPRTLNVGQLNHAREAAVQIIQTMEMNDSSTAFTEGLLPVVPVKEVIQIQETQKLAAPKAEPCCGCACSSNNVDESPDITKIREPVSAPF